MASRLPRVTADEVLRTLRRAGWHPTEQTGSHVQLRHPDRPGWVTVAYHRGIIVKPKTLLSILAQARMTIDEFRALL